ncbi:MAG: phospholipase D-like domain-containing protein, partial [Candidatus Acidiferrales bacterium]
ELAFNDPANFAKDPLATQWNLVPVPGNPPVRFCFSPHVFWELSLKPVGAAIDQATSSVFFAIAFLYQTTTGAIRSAIDRLMIRTIFSYGISDKVSSLEVTKPDGSIGIVDFEYLSKHAPEPFKTEWSGGAEIHQRDKFVVTDFNLPTAKVFTGSSNLSSSGEEGNGDNLVMIEDSGVATAYAIDALRLFDHLQFRTLMQEHLPAGTAVPAASDALRLKKPTAISGKPAWFERFYVPGSQIENDRKLFSH